MYQITNMMLKAETQAFDRAEKVSEKSFIESTITLTIAYTHEQVLWYLETEFNDLHKMRKTWAVNQNWKDVSITNRKYTYHSKLENSNRFKSNLMNYSVYLSKERL